MSERGKLSVGRVIILIILAAFLGVPAYFTWEAWTTEFRTEAEILGFITAVQFLPLGYFVWLLIWGGERTPPVPAELASLRESIKQSRQGHLRGWELSLTDTGYDEPFFQIELCRTEPLEGKLFLSADSEAEPPFEGVPLLLPTERLEELFDNSWATHRFQESISANNAEFLRLDNMLQFYGQCIQSVTINDGRVVVKHSTRNPSWNHRTRLTAHIVELVDALLKEPETMNTGAVEDIVLATRRSRVVERAARINLGLAWLALTVVGGIFYTSFTTVENGKNSVTWPSVTGEITFSEMRRHGTSRSKFPKLNYVYTVDGKRYFNDVLGFGLYHGTKAHVDSILEEYPKGKRVTVYYDFRDPSIATLEQGESSFIRFVAAMALILEVPLLIGLILILSARAILYRRSVRLQRELGLL